jgi:gamma-glutamylcyclotransferase (GGCT)/AIG2-like uncharacterized protein YtfP
MAGYRGQPRYDSEVNPHLFVYGTLLSTAGHPMGARLRREARLIGAASMQGRLYRLGRYPGLVEAAQAGARVHGEVYALNTPAAALRWLDAYEGILPGDQDQNDYKRVERPVQLASGEEIIAWVYVYHKPVAALSLIPDGRWTPGTK